MPLKISSWLAKKSKLGLVSLIWAAVAWGAPSTFEERLRLDIHVKKKENEPASSMALPIQEAMLSLSQKRSDSAQKVAKIKEYLGKQKIPEALILVSKLKRDLRYRDYALSLESELFQNQGERALAQKKWKEGLDALSKAKGLLFEIGKDRPESPLLEDQSERAYAIEVAIAEAFFQLKQKPRAQESLEMAFERLASSRFIALVRLPTLQLYTQLCKEMPSVRCEGWLRKILEHYPENALERKAVLEILPAARDYQAALPVFERVTKKYTVTDRDQKAIEEAFKDYFDGKFEKAAEKFNDFLTQYPKSSELGRARFWFAKTLEKIGEAKPAEFFFKLTLKESPLSFYGLSAAHVLGRSPQQVMSGSLPMVDTSDPNLTPRELLRLSRAEELLSQKQVELARKELDTIRVKPYFSSAFCMYLATLNDAVGNHLRAYEFLTELIQRNSPLGYSTHQVRLTFSTPYYEMIRKAAERVNLDPLLLLSLVKQESSFEPATRSGSGAIGLAQLMPYTALEVDPQLLQRDIFDPEKNLELGARYLAKVIDQFSGNIPIALAGYNAGPTRVRSWLKEFSMQERSLHEFIEWIPYSETRNYVRSILRNYFWYYTALKGNDFKGFESFWIQPTATR